MPSAQTTLLKIEEETSLSILNTSKTIREGERWQRKKEEEKTCLSSMPQINISKFLKRDCNNRQRDELRHSVEHLIYYFLKRTPSLFLKLKMTKTCVLICLLMINVTYVRDLNCIFSHNQVCGSAEWELGRGRMRRQVTLLAGWAKGWRHSIPLSCLPS